MVKTYQARSAELITSLGQRNYKIYTDFLFSTFFTHFQLYKHVLSNSREENIPRVGVDIHTPIPPLPLASAKELSVWNYEASLSELEKREAELEEQRRLRKQQLEAEATVNQAACQSKVDSVQTPFTHETLGEMIRSVLQDYATATSKAIATEIKDVADDLQIKFEKTSLPRPAALGWRDQADLATKIGSSLVTSSSGSASNGGSMVSRGIVSDDVSYVLLEAPLVPRLDLSDCRPTELPVLPETTASQGSPTRGSMQLASGQMSAPNEPRDRVPVLPRAPIGTVTEVKTVVVDMREMGKLNCSPATANSTGGRTSDNDINSDNTITDSSNDNDVLSGEEGETVPSQGREKRAGVLKGRPPLEPQETQEQHLQAMGQQHTAVHQHRFTNFSRGSAGAHSSEPALPAKRFRLHGQHLRHLQAEARLREAYAAAASRSVEGYRHRRSLEEESANSHLPPFVSQSHGFIQPGRRVPLFSFKRNCAMDAPGATQHHHQQQHQQQAARDGRSRRNFVLPQNPGVRPVKGQVRFQDEDIANASHSIAGESALQHGEGSEFSSLHARHVEPRHHTSLRRDQLHNGLPAGGPVSELPPHHPRIGSGKPPIPRSHSLGPPVKSSAESLGGGGGGGGGSVRATSASSRSSSVGRSREFLSVDSLPSSAKSRQRPSTVSSASSSARSREISSAKQRIGSSVSRASSASMKAASDPGVDLDNMDLVTLNLMARRAKGPSRYRYLAKLRSLNLNTPRPLA
nr:hypothetical protein BaRGS_020357 [Batillaria attramentaria]